MAQHKLGERVRPEDILECVKKHRLFPQAEASIRLRIPDIKKSFNLGLEVWLTHLNSQKRKCRSQCAHDYCGSFHIICLRSAGSQPVRSHGRHTDPQWECWRRAGLGVSAHRLHVRHCHHRVSQSHGHDAACLREEQHQDQWQVRASSVTTLESPNILFASLQFSCLSIQVTLQHLLRTPPDGERTLYRQLLSERVRNKHISLTDAHEE